MTDKDLHFWELEGSPLVLRKRGNKVVEAVRRLLVEWKVRYRLCDELLKDGGFVYPYSENPKCKCHAVVITASDLGPQHDDGRCDYAEVRAEYRECRFDQRTVSTTPLVPDGP